MRAECQCGRLSVTSDAEPSAVVACHCIACQRRTGSPFAVLAYYPQDRITVVGDARGFERRTDSGGRFESSFCPTCGSTVFVRASKHPTSLGVAVGAMGDPGFPGPVRSVWEQSRHDWVEVAAEQHFPQGRP